MVLEALEDQEDQGDQEGRVVQEVQVALEGQRHLNQVQLPDQQLPLRTNQVKTSRPQYH